MDRSDFVKDLLKKIKSKKGQDYTFLAIFFLTFSAFIFFAIKPSLTTAFALNKQKHDLEQLDNDYEKAITTIVSNQSALEASRDNLYLLDEAFPNSPAVNNLVTGILKAGRADSVTLNNISVSPINFINKTKNKQKDIVLNVTANSTYDNLIKFIHDLLNQRRLKTIDSLDISTANQISSQSGQLNIQMQIEGFYL